MLLTKRSDDAEKRVAEAAQKISALQAELAQAERTEARSESQIKSLKEQNAALADKADTLAREFKDAAIKVARLETKLEAQQEKRK